MVIDLASIHFYYLAFDAIFFHTVFINSLHISCELVYYSFSCHVNNKTVSEVSFSKCYKENLLLNRLS